MDETITVRTPLHFPRSNGEGSSKSKAGSMKEKDLKAGDRVFIRRSRHVTEQEGTVIEIFRPEWKKLNMPKPRVRIELLNYHGDRYATTVMLGQITRKVT
jgi:hypothetical protein